MKKAIIILLFLFFSQHGFSIQISRVLDRSSVASGKSILVTLRINKDGVDGIAKLIEDIPAGFRAVLINNGGGRVIPDGNGDLRIVWLTMPVNDNFIVQYRLLHVAKSRGGFYISGSFSYLYNNAKQEYSIPPSQINISDSVILAKDEELIDSGKNELRPQKVAGVLYTVQLGVFSSEKEKVIFKDLPEVYYISKGGFYVYCSGKFPDEDQALRNAEKAKKIGFKGAFVKKIK